MSSTVRVKSANSMVWGRMGRPHLSELHCTSKCLLKGSFWVEAIFGVYNCRAIQASYTIKLPYTGTIQNGSSKFDNCIKVCTGVNQFKVLTAVRRTWEYRTQTVCLSVRSVCLSVCLSVATVREVSPSGGCFTNMQRTFTLCFVTQSIKIRCLVWRYQTITIPPHSISCLYCILLVTFMEACREIYGISWVYTQWSSSGPVVSIWTNQELGIM